MTTLSVCKPAEVPEPRGARIAVATVLALRDALASLRAGLVQHRVHNRRLAEATRARALAREMAGHDPRVASEIFAAADRHERG